MKWQKDKLPASPEVELTEVESLDAQDRLRRAINLIMQAALRAKEGKCEQPDSQGAKSDVQ